MKYYFISYCQTIGMGNHFLDTATNLHPFTWIKQKGEDKFQYSLIAFQEISKEEYDLYWNQ